MGRHTIPCLTDKASVGGYITSAAKGLPRTNPRRSHSTAPQACHDLSCQGKPSCPKNRIHWLTGGGGIQRIGLCWDWRTRGPHLCLCYCQDSSIPRSDLTTKGLDLDTSPQSPGSATIWACLSRTLTISPGLPPVEVLHQVGDLLDVLLDLPL